MHEQLNTYSTFLQQPHTQETGAIAWVDHPQVGAGQLPLPNVIGATPFEDGPGANAPPLGAHTREVLQEYGYSDADIAALNRENAIVVT
jgi:crotonobetainyl-CoA:carnitine CoA-transferase CaiB-like acyl-CoA transferase